ncbi:MAG: glycosyltransferase family 4 protein [Myxococcota bacterium]|nr:glycosyltransferase family 4 protein [Myxococcota bacterium]
MALKILVVVPYFYPAWAYGGIPRLAYGLCRSLLERGHQVTVVTTDALDREDRAPPGLSDLAGIPVHRLPNLSNRLAYDHQLFLPRGARALLQDLVREADIVHLHGYWHLLNNAAVGAAREQKCPVVMTPNGTLPILERKQGVKRLWDLALGRPVRQAVDQWIAVSRAEVNQFARAGLDSERVHLVFNGLDLGEFEALPDAGLFRAQHQIGSGPMILYLGKLTPRKGVGHLLEAISQVRSQEVTLVVAGNDMGVGARLARKAEDLGLGQRARFVGLLTGEERLSALADADLLVYPSTDEIFGLVPFEGLLCGTPAVVSDDCGCGELVAQARAGELVRYGRPEALARSIDGLLDDEGRRRRMVARGRAFIERNFAWPRIALQTEAVYKAALRSR